MDVDDPETPWLDSVEGEIAFFRALMRARPVGIHRHFHVLTMRNTILRDTGQYVELDDLWRKLRSCYDLDNLESIVSEPPDVFAHALQGYSYVAPPPPCTLPFTFYTTRDC